MVDMGKYDANPEWYQHDAMAQYTPVPMHDTEAVMTPAYVQYWPKCNVLVQDRMPRFKTLVKPMYYSLC